MVSSLQKQLAGAEGDKSGLSARVDDLKGDLLRKSTELEEREHRYEELQSKFSEAEEKHRKDLDNVGVQVAQLDAQVTLTWFNRDHIVSFLREFFSTSPMLDVPST